MKKYIFFSLLLLILTPSLKAQTFGEWFSQKKTQRKYLLKQIAELQTYLELLKKGYNIAEQGLDLIHSVKNGEFNLHNIFYSSLMKVNPRVTRFSEVAATVVNVTFIISQINQITKAKDHLSASDIAAIATTTQMVLTDCRQVVSDLLDVTSPGVYGMTDDQRVTRIHELYSFSLAQVAFIREYSSQTSIYAAQKLHDDVDTRTIGNLYDQK